MAIAEQQPEIPVDQQITEIPDAPEIPAAVEQAGVTQAQPTMQPVQDDNNQPVAQPVPAPASPAGPSVTIPAANAQQLTQMSKGNTSNSSTWFGVFWLKKIKRAIKDSLLVLFKGEQK